MGATIDHVILTRFNLPSPGVESLVRARDGWLRNRIALFEEYCLPSVAAQTERGFHWLIYFDPESPAWLRERITTHTAAGAYTPVFRASVDHSELMHDLAELTGAGRDVLITTNLDNDDALAVDFVERLQARASAHPRAAVYFRHGLILSPEGLYARTDRHNAFCSVREGWDDAATCWADWHDLLPRHMPVEEIRGAPGWLQVVHGGNVSNRVHGRLMSPAPYRRLFPPLIDDDPVPTRAAVLRDRAIGQPFRWTRDVARSAVKHTLRLLLGKQGLDNAKSAWARLRRPARRGA